MDVASPELPQFIRLILALAFVLALMGGLAFLSKKLGLSNNASVKSGGKKRLQIVEALPLDARRRLAIIKCDEREHLVILNANSETVIEKNIPSVDDSSDSRSSS